MVVKTGFPLTISLSFLILGFMRLSCFNVGLPPLVLLMCVCVAVDFFCLFV